MTSNAAPSTSTPPAAIRRAGPGSSPANSSTAAPALAAAPAPKTNGSSWRASCHTGTAVSDSSTPV